jgi:hypothetical protein
VSANEKEPMYEDICMRLNKYTRKLENGGSGKLKLIFRLAVLMKAGPSGDKKMQKGSDSKAPMNYFL